MDKWEREKRMIGEGGGGIRKCKKKKKKKIKTRDLVGPY